MRLSLATAISHGRVYRRLGLGPESRIHLLRNLLTGLVRHERIEATWARVDEMRGYAEKVRAQPFLSKSSLGPPLCPCVGSRAHAGRPSLGSEFCVTSLPRCKGKAGWDCGGRTALN